MSSEKSKCIKKYHRTVVSVVFCCFSAWRTAVHDVQPSDRTAPCRAECRTERRQCLRRLEFRGKFVRDVGKDAFSGRKAAVNIPVAANPVSASTPFSRHTFSISRSTIEVLTFGFGLPFSISTFIFFVVTSPVQPVSAKKSGIKAAQMPAHTALFSLHHKAPFRHCK